MIALYIIAPLAHGQNTNIMNGFSHAVFSDLDMNNNGSNDRINWRPLGQESVIIDEGAIAGFIWGESVGWIQLQPNTASMDPVVLAPLGGVDAIGLRLSCGLTEGQFTGYIWGENTGWINMNPTQGGVTLLSDGSFDGFAWSENFGWIEFSCPGDACVRTEFSCDSSVIPVPPTTPPTGGGGGSGFVPVDPPTIDPIDPMPAPEPPLDPSMPAPDTSTPDTDPIPDTDSDSPEDGDPDQVDQETEDTDPAEEGLASEGSDADRQGFMGRTFSDSMPQPIPLQIAQIIAVIAAISTIPGVLSRMSNILLAFVGLWKKNKPWGTVYDARTKQPLDPAYVQLLDEQDEEVAGSITDADGRYGFIADPGRYRLHAQKTHYTFPSQILSGKHKDELYDHLYFGEWFTIEEHGQVIAKNIPLDPEGDDWNEKEKLSMGKGIFVFFSKYDRLIIRVVNILFAIGFIFAIYALIISPNLFNVIVFGIYVLLAVLFIAGFSPASSGRITYADGTPAAHLIIRVFNPHLDKEVMHKLTDDEGYYFILIHTGEYYVTIERKNEDGSYEKIFTSSHFKASRGIINKRWIIGDSQ